MSADGASGSPVSGLPPAIALTAVSFGMARADTLGAIVDGRDGALAVTTFFALLVAGMGGITAVVTRRDRRRD